MAKYPFENMSRRWRKLRPVLPKVLAEVAINDFQQNFRRGGYRDAGGGTIKWKNRQPTYGDNNRGVLIGKGSGRMMRDFHNRSNRAFAKVVNQAPYAAVHNEGLKLRGNKRVFVGYSKKSRPKYKRTAQPAKMPKRPFMITTEPLMKDIEQAAFDEIENLFKTL